MSVAGSQENDGKISQEDRRYMRRALDLAERGKGKTFPNPCVGCVLVKDGKVVGEGFHPRAGMPHAEVYALHMAGDEAAKGCTAYVTLEPCNHSGRTPPCSMALVDAKVSRVVIAVSQSAKTKKTLTHTQHTQ
jgi:diaminohydroxyphosphoribosylaminopyrimidine deaminase/5-amino-6-(5-phosphoribosylamino)uracil reductase